MNKFDENGALSREFLLKRGWCCSNKCTNCPYFPRHQKGATEVFKVPDKVNCTPSCTIEDMQNGKCICHLENKMS